MSSIYVGNLPYNVTEDDLRELFAQHGTVDRVALIMDRMTGRSRGFAFVDMPDDSAAQAAIDALNGTEMEGRSLTVNVARPKAEGDDRGGRGGRGGGGGGRGGGRRW